MKRTFLPLLLFAAATFAAGETFLRIDGGVEHYSGISTNGMPAEIAVALRERSIAAGWLPYEPARRPPDTWCTTWVRTLTQTNGVWREGWAEASVPVPLDRVMLVGAVLALPDGTNLLAAAMGSEPVAAWFAGAPTYIRGSAGARMIAAVLGITQEQLESIAAVAADIHPAPVLRDNF